MSDEDLFSLAILGKETLPLFRSMATEEEGKFNPSSALFQSDLTPTPYEKWDIRREKEEKNLSSTASNLFAKQ